MDNKNDIRWIQRFSNFSSALKQLNDAVTEFNQRELNPLEKQGLIKAYEFTFELAWNVMKDYFEYQGNNNLRGSRDAFRVAFKNNIIDDVKTWMKMIETRNITSHTYNEEIVDEIILLIVKLYINKFNGFERTIKSIKNEIGRTM